MLTCMCVGENSSSRVLNNLDVRVSWRGYLLTENCNIPGINKMKACTSFSELEGYRNGLTPTKGEGVMLSVLTETQTEAGLLILDFAPIKISSILLQFSFKKLFSILPDRGGENFMSTVTSHAVLVYFYVFSVWSIPCFPFHLLQ